MSLKDEFLKAVSNVDEPAGRSRKWVPGVEWLGSEGTLTTAATVGTPQWDELLLLWGLDPEEYEVVEPVLFNSWGGDDGLTHRQYKAKVIRRVSSGYDITEAIKNAMRYKPNRKEYGGDSTLNVVLADWQIGKSDSGGVEATIQRILDARAAVVARANELRKIGRQIRTLNVLWTGDSVEGCVGFYPRQTFTVQLNRREQVTLARRLLVESLQAWSKHFDEIIVAAVAGNHGENRSNGKAFTTADDNDDLAVVEQCAEILQANPDVFGHVKFLLARDALTCTVPSSGWTLGITHGHITRSGANAEMKLRNWYNAQSAGRQKIGDADILVSGHFHHLRVADWGGCIWLQAPALDGGSEYWRAQTGEQSMTGVLTFVSTPTMRVQDVAVL